MAQMLHKIPATDKRGNNFDLCAPIRIYKEVSSANLEMISHKFNGNATVPCPF